MAVNEITGFLKYKDAAGDINLLFPITTKDNVDGLDEIENELANAVKVTSQTLTEDQKAQARVNIGAASSDGVATQDWVLDEIAKIDVSGGGSGGTFEQIQSDWNQNDSSQPDFIKNRPFGELVTKTDFIPTTDMRFSYFSDEGTLGHEIAVSTELLTMWNGDWTSVDVAWDGTVYTCEPFMVGGVIKCVGNQIVIDSDNGIPFVIMVGDAATIGSDRCIIYSVVDIPNDAGEAPDVVHNVGIVMNQTDIMTIDPKYLPDDIGGGSSLPEVTASDAGKFLRVGSDGTWVVEAIQDVSEVGM